MYRAHRFLFLVRDQISRLKKLTPVGASIILIISSMSSTSQPIQFISPEPSIESDWDQIEWTIEELTRKGEFSAAGRLITSWLDGDGESSLSLEQKQMLEMQGEWMRRVAKDYGLTRQSLLSQLQRRMEGASELELKGWIQEGRFDCRVIDGEIRFLRPSVSNLYFRYPELNARRVPRPNPAQYQSQLLKDARKVKELAKEQKSFQVAPVDYEVLMQLTVQPNAAPDGQLIQAWAPVPRGLPFQSGFEWISTIPEFEACNEQDSLIRAVYFERTAVENHPTFFELKYRYTAKASWFPLGEDNISCGWSWKAGMSSDPQIWSAANLEPYLTEARHVEFSDVMREKASMIVGDRKEPVDQAQAIYDWIRNNIQYSYAREYSTIKNISEYCLSKGYGDCGQEALLMITLLRIQGIPARWQSGWYTFPGYETIHDWIEIYLEPFGWVPCDPYMGIYATQYGTQLTYEEREELAGFYFGGLDPYRMAANSDHCQRLTPAKLDWRSDDVDFQRGEIESGGKNIYFDQYDYGYSIRVLKNSLD